MKLVIDVSKNNYEDMKKAVSEGIYDYNGTMANLIKSVSNGIILPDNKDCRLINAVDLEKTLKKTYDQNLNSFFAINGIPDSDKTFEHYVRMGYLITKLDQIFEDICKIRQAKIIFEADKDGE